MLKFIRLNHWGQVHRPWSHRDRYVGSLVYRESVVPVPMIREDKYCIKGCKNQDVRLSKAYLTS